MTPRSRIRWAAALGAVLLVLGGCVSAPPVPPPGIGAPVSWSALPGWTRDDQARAWPALRAECPRLASQPAWAAVCRAAQALPAPSTAAARRFFMQWFVPHEVLGLNGERQGLMTGYYEPVVAASLRRTARFRYPLYRRPASLLRIDLSALYPALAGQRVRGRLVDSRVVPYYSREDIDEGQVLRGNELIWLDNPVTAFIIQVQGSAIARLPDGRLLGLRYADQNGYPYRPLLECFQKTHIPPPAQLDLPGLKQWLNAHPRQARTVLDCNPSFVFFSVSDATAPPKGALGVPLTARRSIAVDPHYVALGLPVWLDVQGMPLQRLVFAQDVGGAIRGPVRADFFWGRGREAGQNAGQMKNPGTEFVLIPRRAPGPPA